MASATRGVLQPPQLHLDNVSVWLAKIQTFDDYHFASGLNEHSEAQEDDAKKLDVVNKRFGVIKKGFDEYFVNDRFVKEYFVKNWCL
ncbi:hypothetical protein MRX96_052170 [Rhipicephalus microplus]